MSEHRYRTLGARFAAGFIDIIVVLPFLLILYVANLPDIVGWFVGVAMIISNLAYFVILHGRNGQTLGKRVMRVRVVRAADEGPISYKQSLWRESPLIALNVAFFGIEGLLFTSEPARASAMVLTAYSLLQPLPNLWWLADAAVAFFNPKRRSIHDFIGDTVVVSEW